MFLAGMVAALAGISLGQLSRLWVFLDIFSHLTLHFVLAAAAFGIACLMPGRRLLTALIVMFAGCLVIGGWRFVGGDNLPASRASAAGYRELTVMSFNTWHRNSEFDRIDSEVSRVDPDILFLAEYGLNKRQLGRMLAKRYPYQVPRVPTRYLHLAMFSKYPLDCELSQPPWAGPAFVHVRLGGELRGLSVTGTHLIRPPHVRAQYKQIKKFGAYISSIRGQQIVMGDFNATPLSRMLREYGEDTGQRRITSRATWPSTWPHLPQLAIDHFFITPDVKVIGGPVTGRFAGSDHLPIVARFIVPVGQTETVAEEKCNAPITN